MKKVILSAVLAAMVLSFAGCGDDVKTVEYYKEHADERIEKIAECRNNPGGMKDDPNCKNAFVGHSAANYKKTDKTGGKTIDDFMPPYNPPQTK